MVHTSLLVVAATAACDVERALPPAPAAAQASAERALAERLRAHVAAIPGVATVSAIVHLPVVDPFGPFAPPEPGAHAAPARIAAVVVTDAGADTRLVHDATATAAHTLGGADADVTVEVVRPPASTVTTSVGPFEVAARSRRPLLATLACGLIVIATLAALLAWALARRAPGRRQRGMSPQ